MIQPPTNGSPPVTRPGEDASAENLRRVLEASADGFLVCRADGGLAYKNPSASDLVRGASGEALESILATPAGAHHELMLERDKMSPVALRVSGMQLTWDGQAATLVTLRDLTDERAAEAGRARAERRVLDAQRMRTVGTLAGGVAHEFNNLLTVIISSCHLLEHQATTDEQIETAGMIRDAADRAAERTRQLLAVGSIELEPRRPLSVRKAYELLGPILKASMGDGIDLVMSESLGDEHVETTPDAIEQTVLDLALNAKEAMPEGGSLRVSFTPFETARLLLVEGGTLQPGRYVGITVEDSGHGMDAAVQAQIFDPFYSTKGAGRGLGLSSTYGRLRQLGGGIAVRSTPGVGTRFQVYLPNFEAAEEEEPAAPTGMADIRGLRVLAIEDRDDLREMLRRLLEQLGCDVSVAGNAKDAHAVWQERAGGFDVIVSDVVMPDTTGTTLTSELRAGGSTPPVVLMTGYAKKDLAPGMLECPNSLVMFKPFTITELAESIATAAARTDADADEPVRGR